MTDCEHFRQQLSPLVDRELPDADANVVKQHLESCPSCLAEWESLQAVDEKLNQLLTIEDIGDRVANIEQAAQVAPSAKHTRRHLLRWSAGIAAIAASIAIMFFATRPNQVPDPPSPAIEIVAHLVRATGPVEFQPPDSDRWTSIQIVADFEVPKGARLRTRENVLIELLTADQGKLRLNESAELVVHDANKLELLKGQLWLAARDADISIDVPIRDKLSGTLATMKCPSQSEYQCEAGDTFAACDSVSKDNPPTAWSIGDVTCRVDPGESVSIDAKHKVDRNTAQSGNKIWQLPLLAVGNRADDEFLSSIKGWLAPIGMSKARHLNEQQIRMLGPKGALPLLAFVHAEQEPDQLRLRRTAMSIARDLADERAIDLLRKIETDPDAFISAQAKRALKRIAQQAN